MPSPGTIVTVCTANICRSPMAEALLRHALSAQPEPLRSLKVVSAGVSAHEGEAVSENSVTALKKVGLNVSGHRSRQLTPEMLREAVAVFCMTEGHRRMIELSFDPVPRNVYLLREFLPKGADIEIADPFGGPLRHYEACRDEMVEAIPSIVAFLKTQLAAKA